MNPIMKTILADPLMIFFYSFNHLAELIKYII
jgi:hypothetical protein